MSEPVVTHKPRGLYVVTGALGICVVILAVLLVAVNRQATANQATVRRLAGVVAAERQDEQRQQRLIRDLQQQVRDCQHSRKTCGPPLTQPRPQTQPETREQPTGSLSAGSSSPSPTGQPRPSRTPRPSPTPRPSVSPTPSPSPSCDLQHLLRCVEETG